MDYKKVFWYYCKIETREKQFILGQLLGNFENNLKTK
jgi:hypothetical protein